MSILPLSHHEIVALIAPFARRGRHADLAASDRLARRLQFAPREHPGDDDSLPAHREVLQLEDAARTGHRLTRTLITADGLRSTLHADGDDLDTMLALFEGVPHARQLQRVAGFGVAVDLVLDPRSGAVVPTGGAASTGGLTLTMTVPRYGRHAALVLSTALDDPIELPDDLLAVLGHDWSRLDSWTESTRRRWNGTVRLARNASDAEAKLRRTGEHLDAVLAEPPPRFHEVFAAARWRFAFRRSIPMLVCIALIVGAVFFTRAGLSQDSVVRMLIFNAPPLMLVAFFCLRELPRIEWPRRPRRPTATAWRPSSIG